MDAILTGLSGAEAVAAVLGGCAIIALVGFSVWGGKKVAGLFGGR